MSGWKQANITTSNGIGYKIIGEIEPDHYRLLIEKGAEFSKKIMEMEELLILTSMDTSSLEKLKALIEAEIKSR
jgi:hypothetical protein